MVLLVPGSSTARAQSSRPAASDVKIDYDQHVKPILAAKCFGCHGKQQQSGLRLDRRQPALRGGDYGPVITPGNSAESKLIQRITGSEAGLQMPPTGALEDDEIAVLRAWIDQGADMRPWTPKSRSGVRPIRKFRHFSTRFTQTKAAFSSALTTDKAMARAADAAGSTVLMHAAYAGTVEMMATLIDAGADVNAANDRRATALH